jgi:threonine dehydratase
VEPIAVTAGDVEAALDVVREVAWRTPTTPFHEGPWLKLESHQRLGSFKIRGTWNRLARLGPEERRRGVATVSSGNHGLAVAWGARRLGLPCLVRVPEGANARKVAAIEAEGAVVESTPRADLVGIHEQELWRSWPRTFIHPFAHAATVAGQGTAGWELAEDVPDARTVLVPAGGGGLAAGIALAVKDRVPGAKVFAVQAEGASALEEALRTGRPGHVEHPETIADGIRIGIALANMLPLLHRHLDGCLVVRDDEILEAMRGLYRKAHLVAEPAGAAALAAWRRYRQTLEAPVVAVVSGGNVEPSLFEAIRSGGPTRGP